MQQAQSLQAALLAAAVLQEHLNARVVEVVKQAK